MLARLLVPVLAALAIDLPVCAEKLTDEQTAQALSNRLLSKELELYRLGIELKSHSESRKLWRERRFTLYALANSSLTSIGAFMAGGGRLHFANRPAKAPASLFENATIVRVVANSISVGGVIVEFSKDAVDAHSDRRHHLNLASIVRQAQEIESEIHSLQEQRSVAASQISNESLRKLYQSEDLVLNDVHEAGLDELAAFYADAKAKKTRRIVQLALTGTSNLVSGAGSLYSGVIVPHRYKSDPIKRVRYGGVGGITDIATGSTNVMTPLICSAAEILRRRDSKAVLFKQVGAHDVKDLEAIKEHEKQVQSALRVTSDQAIAGFEVRRKAIATVIAILEKHKEINDSERKDAVEKLVLSVLDSGVDSSGSFSKIVNGVGTTVGAYRYTRDAHKRFLVTGRAGITYGIGNAIGTEEVIRDGITREFKQSSKRKRHLLLSQILGDEVTSLRQSQLLLGEAD